MTFCRKYVEWKKNPNWKTGSTDWKPISCYNCGKHGRRIQTGRPEVPTGSLSPVIIVANQDILFMNVKERDRIMEEEALKSRRQKGGKTGEISGRHARDDQVKDTG